MTPGGLRVAVLGSGPSGLYAIGHLLETRGLHIDIDLYERLPTPWGLVRGGVAPDHPEKKLIIDRLFGYWLKNPRVRFLGNVEIGSDISHAELSTWYDAIIYAVGATGDLALGIPGENLPGSWAAREFVGYYNGHPDFTYLKFDLQCERAVIVGNGNVALDMARILTMPSADLEHTDIADHALELLKGSAIREVVLLGRRGPLQAAFNNPELEELEHLRGVDVQIAPEDIPALHDASADDSAGPTRRKIKTLRRLSERVRRNNKRILLRFQTSPTALVGSDRVTRVNIVRNHLEHNLRGELIARPSKERGQLESSLVLRACGYRGTPFPGLPYDERLGIIRNVKGRVVDEQPQRTGTYVTGWIKRGCRGIIGSNKKCARETVDCLLEDRLAGRLSRNNIEAEAVTSMILRRQSNAVFLPGWFAIDHTERAAGRGLSRPRVKITHWASLLQCAQMSRR